MELEHDEWRYPGHRPRTRAWAERVVMRLDEAMHTVRGRRVRKAPKPHLRQAIKDMGYEPVPFGDGDAKTGAPGMYRAVGSTCPLDCGHHPANDNTCYANSGNVGIHQRTARGASIESAAVTAAACMVWALHTGRVARLHVSGDLGVDDGDPLTGAEFDHGYADLLATLARAVRDWFDTDGTVAWTYTAFTGGAADAWCAELEDSGISVRKSGRVGKNGAITAPFEALPALRKASGVRIAKCPAQLRDVSCIDCALCWTRPDVCIAFDPHGTGGSKARRLFNERN